MDLRKRTWTIKKRVEIIKVFSIGKGFYYNTSDFVNLKESNFRYRVNYFKKHYDFKIKLKYNNSKVISFLNNTWLKNQKIKTISFKESYDFFLFCLKNKNKYGIKTIFIEINNKLVGVAMGVPYDKKRWIALHEKVDYNYKELGRFLHHIRASFFSNYFQFTSGGMGKEDKGIETFKTRLNPCKVEKYFYVITGEKLKK